MNDLQRIEPTSTAIVASDPEAILRYAIDQKADITVINGLMAVRRELKAEKAKADYDDAMSALQMECPVIVKKKGVPDRNGNIAYKYAPIEDLAAIIKPLCFKYGFSYSFSKDTTSEAGWVICICRVTHRSGHSETYPVKLPLGGKTAIMSDTQQYASAMTFGDRRALQSAFGLTIAGEDLDARLLEHNKPKGPNPIAPDANDAQVRAAAKTLWNMLKPVRGSEMNWIEANKFMVQNKILTAEQEAPNLPLAELQEAISKARISIQERMGS